MLQRSQSRVVSAGLCILLAGCSTAAAQKQETITVGAAASLTSVFAEIGSAFERAHPGAHVRFSFAGSNALATQIQEGAPVDVFAAAAPRWLDVVAKDPGVVERAVFARNRLVLIEPKDNAAHILRFSDLARAHIKLVLAAPGVPAGDYARAALRRAGLSAAISNVVSNEQDVEGVVQKVVSGDADAGIVYATDVTASVARSVHEIELPPLAQVIAVYEIGVVRGTRDPGLGRAFIAYVLGPGQVALARAGFIRAA